MLTKILLLYALFMLGVVAGMILNAMLSTNRQEDERNEAYILGYKDCMQDRPPRVQIR